MSSITSSPYVLESTVVKASVDKVWSALSKLDFNFWSLLESSKRESSSDDYGAVNTLKFKDGTTQKVAVVAFSSINRTITYEVLESNPEVQYSSALHTITAQKVTSDGSTFVSWSVEFSSDASAAVIQDSKHKRSEALAELKKSLE